MPDTDISITQGSGTKMAVFNDGTRNHAKAVLEVMESGTPQPVQDAHPVPIKPIPQTSGGTDPYTDPSLRSTPVQVKGTGGTSSAGQIYGFYATNSATTWRYLKFYDTATAPTVGTTTPKRVFGIPPGGGGCIQFPAGMKFSNGIWAAATTGAPNSDTGDPNANEIVINVEYV